MPALLELLDHYFFADVPGMQARAALVSAWEQTSGTTWHELYTQSLDDSLDEELPHLSAFTGHSTPRPTRAELAAALATDLGEPGITLQHLALTSGAFLTELARAMQAQRLILIDQRNLFTDEYRQILLNLFDHAHARFKSIITAHSAEFSDALGSAAQRDAILVASIVVYLARQFGIALPLTISVPPSSSESNTSARAEPASPESLNASVEPPTAPEVPPTAPESIAPPSQPASSAVPPNYGSPMPPLKVSPRAIQNRLRVLLATPADVQTERARLTKLIQDTNARVRARFGLELEIINPTLADISGANSAVELADIFIGVIWLQFGKTSVEADAGTGESLTPLGPGSFFAGTEMDFALALEPTGGRGAGWLRTVIYRSIHPPLDLLRMNVAEYTRVQQFFERAGALAGEDFVRVYTDASELIADARARLEAWIYNYAGDLANALAEYGKMSAALGQNSDARADFEQAIALHRELDHPTQELALWLQVAALYRRENRRAQAAEALDAALRLARLVEDDDSAAIALHQNGLLAADALDWRSAQRAFQHARAYLKPDAARYREIVADEIDALENLGDVAHAAGDSLHARDGYRDALLLAEQIDDAPRAAVLWQKLGAHAAAQGEWSNALDCYAQALSNLDPLASSDTRRALHDAQAHAHLHLAVRARETGDPASADLDYRAALTAIEQGSNDRARRIEIFTALGELAAERELWTQAIEWNTRALAELDPAADASPRAQLWNAQANIYQRMGDAYFAAQEYQGAANAYGNAFTLFQDLDARMPQAVVLRQLGAVSFAQAHWQAALDFFTQALARLDAPEAQELRAETLGDQAATLEYIGDAHRDAQEWAQAEICYAQARANLEQLDMDAHTGTLLTGLGIVTAAQGRHPEALAYFQQARARLTAPAQAQAAAETMRLEANTLREIADLRRGAGDFAQAEALYRQQLDLAQSISDETLEGDAFHHLGLVAADRELWDDAVNFYDQAFALFDDATHSDARALIQRDELAAYQKLGEREHAARQLPQAEMAYRSALTRAQAVNAQEKEADLLYALGVIAIEREQWDDALVDLRRALGIYNMFPMAPHKSQVIWNIGRAQRGVKRKQMLDALARAHSARDANDVDTAVAEYRTALQLASDLGDAHAQADALEHLGYIASARAEWDNALGYFNAARENIEPADAARHANLAGAQIDALLQRAEVARLAEQWGDADADLAAALELAQELDARDTQSDIIYRRGLIAAGQTHWNEAIDLYSNALDLFAADDMRRGKVELAQADAFQSLGDSEHNAQNWLAAEAAYTQALTLQTRLANRSAQAVLCAALGDVAMRQARWQDAVTQLERARELEMDAPAARVAALEPEIARATLALKRAQQADAKTRGDANCAGRAFADAQADYEFALGLADELRDRTAQAELHATLGFVATERGNFENALEHYQNAAVLCDAPEQNAQRAALGELQAQSLEDLGNRASENGRWNNALTYYQRAIALLDAPAQSAQRNRVVRLAAVTLQNLGDQTRANAEWDAALAFYKRAAGMFALLEDTPNQRVMWARQANVEANLARQARSRGEHAQALAQYHHAESLFRDAQDVAGLNLLQRERVIVLRDAGDAFARDARWISAAAAYQDGYALAQALDDRAAQAEFLLHLGNLYTQQAHLDEALAYFRASLAFTVDGHAPELSDRIMAAQQRAFRALADTQRISGNLENAQANYNGALSAALERNDRASAGELYFVLGTLAADQNAWDKALGNYALALENVESARRDDVKTYQAVAYQNWGDAQRAAGQFDAAASAYMSALDTANELGDDERGGEVLYRFGLLNATLGNWQRALGYYAQAETRLPAAETTAREALARDANFALRAFKRSQFDAQLEHARTMRQELQWDDAATSYRAALALAHDLEDTAQIASAQHELVALYADKGAALRKLELWDEASEAYREELNLAREFCVSDQADARQANLFALGMDKTNALHAAGEIEDAERAAQDTYALAQEFGEPNVQADALYALGALAAQRGDWETAQAHYARARPLLVAAERTDVLVQLDQELAVANDVLARQARQDELLALAATAQAERRYDDAEAEYRSALDLAQGLGKPAVAASIAAHLVKLATERAAEFRAEQDWAGAEAAYRRALAVAQEFDDASAIVGRQKDLIALATEQAQGFRAQADWTSAEQACRRALAVAQEFQDADAVAAQQADLLALAVEKTDALRAAGDATSAARAAEHTVSLAQEFGSTNIQADALYLLGNLAAQRGDWETAQARYAQARPLLLAAERGAVLAHLDQDLAAAQEMLDERARRAANDRSAAESIQLGDELYAQGEWQAAGEQYQRALKFDRANERADRDGDLLSRLARTYAAQSNYPQAIVEYDRALASLSGNELALRDRIIAQLAFTLQQEGKRALAANEWDNAVSVLTRALKMAEASDNFDQAADLALRLGHVYAAQNKCHAALSSYRRAYDLDLRDGSALRERETSQAMADMLLQLAWQEMENAAPERAQAYLDQALSSAERAENPLLLGNIYQTAGDNAQVDEPERAVAYYAQAGRQYALLQATDLWREVARRQSELLAVLARNQERAAALADAESSYRRALLLQQASGETEKLGVAYLGLGRALSAQARWGEASDTFDNAALHLPQTAEAEQRELTALHARALEEIGAAAMNAARWNDATALFERAAQMQDAINARAQAGVDWHRLAQITVAQELWRDASRANQEALARLDTPGASETRRAVLNQQAQILAHIGGEQQRVGELTQASETYHSALVIAQEQGELYTLAELYTRLGSLAEAQADWDTARAEYHHALDVYQELEQPQAQAETWTRLGDMHRAAQQFDAASDAFGAARDLYKKANEPLREGAMLRRLGLVRGDAGDWDGALDWYDETLALYNRAGERSAKIEIYRSIENAVRHAKRKSADAAAASGDQALEAGEWTRAEQTYREAQELYGEVDEPVVRAQMQNQLGVALNAQMRWDEALEQYRAALTVFEEQEIPKAQIRALGNMGDAQRHRAQWSDAEAAYRQALALNQELNDRARAAELYNSLGQTREAQQDWEGAVEYYQAALDACASADLEPTESAHNLTRAQRGARAQEQRACAHALELAREGDDLAEMGELLNTLGLMAAEDQEWDKALRYYREAVTIFEQLEHEADMETVWRTAQGTVLNNIGDASQLIGAWSDAVNAYSGALNIARQVGDRASEPVLLANLGIAAEQLHELPRALDLNLQALDGYRALGDPTPHSELLERIGDLQLQLGQSDAADANPILATPPPDEPSE